MRDKGCKGTITTFHLHGMHNAVFHQRGEQQCNAAKFASMKNGPPVAHTLDYN